MFADLQALHELAASGLAPEVVLRAPDSYTVLPPLPRPRWPEVLCDSCRVRPAAAGVVYDGVAFRVCPTCLVRE